jgi:hypothetical protein
MHKVAGEDGFRPPMTGFQVIDFNDIFWLIFGGSGLVLI